MALEARLAIVNFVALLFRRYSLLVFLNSIACVPKWPPSESSRLSSSTTTMNKTIDKIQISRVGGASSAQKLVCLTSPDKGAATATTINWDHLGFARLS